MLIQFKTNTGAKTNVIVNRVDISKLFLSFFLTNDISCSQPHNLRQEKHLQNPHTYLKVVHHCALFEDGWKRHVSEQLEHAFFASNI